MKRLLITGTRKGVDHMALVRELRWWYTHLSPNFEPVLLVHGAAPGVDRQAAAIWSTAFLPTEPHPADWRTLGPAAGPVRNAEMVALGADQCIAFPGADSVGTYDCIEKAKAAGIPTHVYPPA